MQAQKTGSPAFRNGLIFGLILGALYLVSSGIQVAAGVPQATASGETSSASALTFLGCLVFIIALALFFVAGMNTARATGRVGSGALAGLWTGLIGGIIAGIVSLVVFFVVELPVFQLPAGSGLTPSTEKTAFLIGGIVGVVFTLALYAGIGAGVAALGGLVGKNNYSGPAVSYQESMYQGAGGQPGYPPQQGYPPQPGYPPQQGYPPQPGYPPQQGYPPQPGYPPPPPPTYPGQQ